MEEEKDWYFSFGVNSMKYKDKYVKIHGTFVSSRSKMIDRFGFKWAFQYESLEALGKDKWGLTEVK